MHGLARMDNVTYRHTGRQTYDIIMPIADYSRVPYDRLCCWQAREEAH